MLIWQDLLTRLYDHIDDSERRFKLLRRIDKGIIADENNQIDSVIEDIIGRLFERTDARSGFLFRKQGEQFQFWQAYPTQDAKSHIVEESIPAAAVASSRRRFETGGSVRNKDCPEIFEIFSEETQSLVIRVISVEAHAWGLLILESPNLAMTKGLTFIDAVMTQITIALGIRKNRDALRQYKELHSQFFSQDLDETRCLEILHKHIRRILDNYNHSERTLFQILFLEEETRNGEGKSIAEVSELIDGKSLVIRRSTEPDDLGVRVTKKSVSGRAITSGVPYLLCNPQEKEYFDVYKSFSSFQSQTELAVVIRNNDSSKAIGVVNIESERENAFASTEKNEILDLVQIVSPIINSIRYSANTTREREKALNTTTTEYLKELSLLYAHKFGTPITSVKFNLHAALEHLKLGDSEKAIEIASEINTTVDWVENSLNELWREITSIADITPMDLHETFEEIVTEETGIENIFDDERKIDGSYIEIDDSLADLPPVLATRILREHVRNILKNAMHSVKEKKLQMNNEPYKPRIRIYGRELPKTQTGINGRGEDEIAEINQRIRVSILDNGLGIADKDKENIFELGFSTKDSSGYGLFAARTYARDLGGDVGVKSAKGDYCEIWIELLKSSSTIQVSNESSFN